MKKDVIKKLKIRLNKDYNNINDLINHIINESARELKHKDSRMGFSDVVENLLFGNYIIVKDENNVLNIGHLNSNTIKNRLQATMMIKEIKKHNEMTNNINIESLYEVSKVANKEEDNNFNLLISLYLDEYKVCIPFYIENKNKDNYVVGDKDSFAIKDADSDEFLYISSFTENGFLYKNKSKIVA